MKVEISGGDKLKNKLRSLIKKFGGDKSESVTVGFTQYYALYVHEVQARHKVGQWKYLETPARQLSRSMARTIEIALKKKVPLLQALMLAGLQLQRAAQLLTPVDTSALKASAFTCPTRDVESVSQAAFQKSESIRRSESKHNKVRK